MRQTRKGSLTIKLTLIMAAIVFAVIMGICVFNTVFFERFYTQNTQRRLIKEYSAISAEYVSGSFDINEFKNRIQKVNNLYGINVFVLDSRWNVIYATQNGTDNIAWFQDILFNRDLIVDTIAENDSYTLMRGFDPSRAMNYLEIYGTFENGHQLFMHVTIESLKENVRVFNGFILLIGGVILIVSMFVVYFVSKRIVRPVNELSEIASKMTSLDFNARYIGKANDEIGELGQSMNAMSDSLKYNIEKLRNDIEVRKDFAANVSHELKTPIALIEGYAEGLKESVNDDAESREYYCDVIIDEAFKMDRLVKSLLELSELEQGHIRFESENFDIKEYIDGIVRNNEIILNKKGITVNGPQDGEYPVNFDAFIFENVFCNYFSNAINHCEGEKQIHINIEKNNGYIITVHNTGKTISDTDINKIWDKFYKVDKAHTREYGGNGIGLSVVKAILDSLKLPYGVKNTDNGVLFWFKVENR